MTIEIHPVYGLGSKVVLVPLDAVASVTALMVESGGITYRVSFWWQECQRTEWVSAEDLMPHADRPFGLANRGTK